MTPARGQRQQRILTARGRSPASRARTRQKPRTHSPTARALANRAGTRQPRAYPPAARAPPTARAPAKPHGRSETRSEAALT
jgi:hypothetical protein